MTTQPYYYTLYRVGYSQKAYYTVYDRMTGNIALDGPTYNSVEEAARAAETVTAEYNARAARDRDAYQKSLPLMKKFETTTKLAEAYQKQYNAGCPDKIKHFSVQDVMDVCFEIIPAVSFNRIYGMNEKPGRITMVRDFGYVAA